MKSKKLVALLLAGAMALSTLPMAAMAVDTRGMSDEELWDYYEQLEEQENNRAPVVVAYSDDTRDECQQGVSYIGDSSEENPANYVIVKGEGNSAIIFGDVKNVSTENENHLNVLEAKDGAEIDVRDGGIDATENTDLQRGIYAEGENSTVTVADDMNFSEEENSTAAISANDGAQVKVGGDINHAYLGIDSWAGDVEVTGNIDSKYQVMSVSDSDIDVGGNASGSEFGISADGSNVHVGGDLAVGSKEAARQGYDPFYAAIKAERGSDVIVDGNVKANDIPNTSVNAVLVNRSDVKIGGDLETDLARAIMVKDITDSWEDNTGAALVEVCGNVNGYVDADANSDITVIIGGILDGKLVLSGDLEKPVPADETEGDATAETEESSGTTEWTVGYQCQSAEIKTIVTSEDLPEGAMFILWKAIDEDGNFADEEDMFTLDMEQYEEDIEFKDNYEFDPVDKLDKSDYGNVERALNETAVNQELLDAYINRTYYIIKPAEANEYDMTLSGDDLRVFAGVEDKIEGKDGETDRTNEYYGVRQNDCFTVEVVVPKGFKAVLTTGRNDEDIKVTPMKNGKFMVEVNCAGGGIELAATMEKIMKSIKVEKNTSSSAPALRVTDQKAQISSGNAKLAAKVNCSNMDYARKQLLSVKFYLDKELSDNEYYTVYLNDNGELEVELSPELIAMIAAGYHLVEMELDNGNIIPWEIDLI